MRIGFDVSQTGSGKTGCGYLAHGLLCALAGLDAANSYILYPHFGDHYWEPDPRACARPSCAGGMATGPTFRFFTRSKRFWSKPPQDFEARLGRPDIVHSNNFFCPTGLKAARLVYTLHDLSFFEDPRWSTEANRGGLRGGGVRGQPAGGFRAGQFELHSGPFPAHVPALSLRAHRGDAPGQPFRPPQPGPGSGQAGRGGARGVLAERWHHRAAQEPGEAV